MLQNLSAHGSVIAVALMVYAANVMMEALKRDRSDVSGVHTPKIIKSGFGSLVMIASLPCAIWPAVYVGLFEGWLVGIGAWVVFQLIGAIATILLRINGPMLGVHFMAAAFAYPIGYYLSFNALPR